MTAAQIECVPYTSTMRKDWDEAVRSSRNGTFLFERDFMDYHADRFTDASLIFLRKGKVLAVLPQSVHDEGREWRSHGGLTYGGLVIADSVTVLDTIAIFDEIADLANDRRVATQIYRPTPWIYHRYPSEEDRHVLFRHGPLPSTPAGFQAIRPGANRAAQWNRRRLVHGRQRSIGRISLRPTLWFAPMHGWQVDRAAGSPNLFAQAAHHLRPI